jgi:intracellular septation protein A
MEGDGLGMRFWLKAAGLIVAGGFLIVLSWLVLSGLFMRFGFIAAIVVVFGALGLVAHHYDTKKERRYTDGA